MLQQHNSPSLFSKSLGTNNFNIDGLNLTNDTLLVWIESQTDTYHMVLADLIQVFNRYGPIQSVQLLNEGYFALIQFMNHNSTKLAIKQLDGKSLKGVHGILRVQLLSNTLDDDSSEYSEESQMRTKIVKKYTVRYDVQIDPDDGFDVAKRIIGIKGINMKQIHNKTHSKLRLRGKGSGYLEGHNRKEAQEPLHLCISCQDITNYIQARNMVEDLLIRIYKEYDAWRIESNFEVLALKPKYHETLIQFPVSGKFQQSDNRELDNEHFQDYKDLINIDNFIDFLKLKLKDSPLKFQNVMSNMQQDHIASSNYEKYFSKDDLPNFLPPTLPELSSNTNSSAQSNIRYSSTKYKDTLSENFNYKENFEFLNPFDYLENSNTNFLDKNPDPNFFSNLAYYLKKENLSTDDNIVNNDSMGIFLKNLPNTAKEYDDLGHFNNKNIEVPSVSKQLISCNESYFGLINNQSSTSLFNNFIPPNQYTLNY